LETVRGHVLQKHFPEHMQTVAQAEGVVGADRQRRGVGRRESRTGLVDDGSLEPDADADVPLSVESVAAFSRERIAGDSTAGDALRKVCAAVMCREWRFSLEEGRLTAP